MIINDLIDTEANLMDWVSAKLKFELADKDMRWLLHESVSGKLPSCISEIVGQCIWNNTYIIKQGSTIFYTCYI